MQKRRTVLAINPGSTSTKVALFEEEVLLWQETVPHAAEELSRFDRLWEQFEYRQQRLAQLLSQKQVDLGGLAAVVGRGGLLEPVSGGTYIVTDTMVQHARAGKRGEHAANLGCALAQSVAAEAGVTAFVVDPISVDEFEPIARYSGHPLIERSALSHALNIHAAARVAAERLGSTVDECNLIVVHLGGGISVAPVRCGRIVDVNDAASDGPFSPERSGGLPLQPFMDLCFSGNHTRQEVRQMVMGRGGLVAYLDTTNAEEIEERISRGDERAREVYEAMAYQIAKEIGAMATVLTGEISAMVITGGLANSEMLVKLLRRRVAFLAQLIVLPGELEMQAMNAGVWRVLKGVEPAKEYPEK